MRSGLQATTSAANAIPGRGVDRSISEDVDAAGDLDEFRDPLDPGDQRSSCSSKKTLDRLGRATDGPSRRLQMTDLIRPLSPAAAGVWP
jgi:hypothetical protein